MKNMTFKIDDVLKKRLAAMAKADRRSSSDFIRVVLEREWERQLAQFPTLAANAAPVVYQPVGEQ